jgi:hypothetical protein
MAGSEESPELAISLALRFPASWTDERWEAIEVVLLFPAGTVGVFP